MRKRDFRAALEHLNRYLQAEQDASDADFVRRQIDGARSRRVAEIRYCTTPACRCGSSLISPKADSYCVTFCCSTFSRALACSGLR